MLWRLIWPVLEAVNIGAAVLNVLGHDGATATACVAMAIYAAIKGRAA